MTIAARGLGFYFRGVAGGALAFVKHMVTSTPVRVGAQYLDDFNRPDYRIGRYRLYWALFENNLYDDVHPWSVELQEEYSLPTSMRGCYNPCQRIGNFWSTHTWVGKLDPARQNGRVADSAAPILTDNEAIRPALARLWRDSNWEANKDITARTGAVMGDVALRVEDDARAGKVRILPVNPATITWVRHDYQGNVDAYIINERRWDPRFDPMTESPEAQKIVDYEERVTRDGDTIYFETYLGGELYPWNGESASYEVDYGFVPLVLVPHSRALPDSCWGWSEFQGILGKVIEADRVASELHTQIRKASDPRFFVAGTQPPPGPSARTTVPAGNPTRRDRRPREHELPMVYGGMGSTCVPMIYPLDIQFTSMEIQNQLANIEKDYPELRYDSARASGDASAKALREVRKACEAKVHGRRVAYDNALVRAQQMALAIGGWRGYDGYDAFDLGSYASGDLDHSIGERTVFLLDPLDRLEEIQAQLTAWQTAKLAQVPDEFFMAMAEFSPEMVALFQRAKADEQAQAINQQLVLMQAQAEVKAAAAPAGGGSTSQ